MIALAWLVIRENNCFASCYFYLRNPPTTLQAPILANLLGLLSDEDNSKWTFISFCFLTPVPRCMRKHPDGTGAAL